MVYVDVYNIFIDAHTLRLKFGGFPRHCALYKFTYLLTYLGLYEINNHSQIHKATKTDSPTGQIIYLRIPHAAIHLYPSDHKNRTR